MNANKRQRKSTMVELVSELEAIQPRTPHLEMMIAEAKAGEFHDYKNEKYVCGKVVLVGYLREANLLSLAQRVIDGEFDEEADDGDIEKLRQDIPQRMWPAFGLVKKQ